MGREGAIKDNKNSPAAMALRASTATPFCASLTVELETCEKYAMPPTINCHRRHQQLPLATHVHITQRQTRVIMPPTLIGGGIKWCFCLTSDVCLTSVCRVHQALSREQRGLGRPNLAQR